MKLLSAVLRKYNRMVLNGENLFAIHPTQPIQLILGTNGSGKSSLVTEFTPLPPDGDDFYKDGSEEKEFSHKGSHYRMVSDFATKAGKHTFIKDGVVLNDAGTSAVQRELVRQHFNMTAEIRGLIQGKERFTTMGPGRRREWLTMLSDSNYDYAIGLFDRLKTRSRDTSGALRRAREDLVAEKNKMISAEEQTRLNSEIDLLHSELNILLENRAPVDVPVERAVAVQERFLRELDEASTRLLRMRALMPKGGNPLRPSDRNTWDGVERPYFESIAEIDDAVTYMRGQVIEKETLVNKAMTDHKKHEEALAMLERTGAQGMEELQSKLGALRDERDAALARRKLKLEGFTGHLAMSALEATMEDLVEIFTSIPINAERTFGQAQLQELGDKVLEQKTSRLDITNEMSRKNAAKQHMEAHRASGDTKCPKCSYVWNEGYNPIRYASVMDDIAELEVKLAKLDAAIVKNEEEIELNRTYGNYYRRFIRLTQTWPILKPFWNYLLEQEYVTKNPRFVISVVETFRFDLERQVEADGKSKEVSELLEFMRRAEQLGDTNIGETQRHLDETEAIIEELTAVTVDLSKRISSYQHYRKQLQEMSDLAGQIALLRNKAKTATEEAVEMMRRETIVLCTRQLQTALARKEEVLSYVTLQQGLIEQLENKIGVLEQEEIVLKHMVREMSPTEGMIAEGLMGFIRIFTGQMNALIKKIWSYPLVIYPCGQGGQNGAELDYRFPIMVKNKETIRKDVAFGSTGIKEIIDVVFRVVAMEYLGLAESPLFLDEFAASFDEVHRSTAMQTVKNLMDQKPFTQLFMVSHYEASYGALTHAEVCVICPANITIPPSLTYNKHVVIS